LKISSQNFGLYQVNRWQAHITTDKPIYRPNDAVFIETLVLNAFSKKPIGLDPLDEWFTELELDMEVILST